MMSDQACGRIEQTQALETPAAFRDCAMERVAVKPPIPLEVQHTAEAVLNCFQAIAALIRKLPESYQTALLDTPDHWTAASHPAWALIQDRSLNS
jgi:hypothetical protein